MEGELIFNFRIGNWTDVVFCFNSYRCTAKILLGMGCEVLAYDLFQSKEAIEMGVKYVDTVEELLPKCQIVTLHCPLMDDTYPVSYTHLTLPTICSV